MGRLKRKTRKRAGKGQTENVQPSKHKKAIKREEERKRKQQKKRK